MQPRKQTRKQTTKLTTKTMKNRLTKIVIAGSIIMNLVMLSALGYIAKLNAKIELYKQAEAPVVIYLPKSAMASTSQSLTVVESTAK